MQILLNIYLVSLLFDNQKLLILFLQIHKAFAI